jgi:hypothetical protein
MYIFIYIKVVPKKPVPTAAEIAAKKYALEKLKEIDQAMRDTAAKRALENPGYIFIYVYIYIYIYIYMLKCIYIGIYAYMFIYIYMSNTAVKRALENPGYICICVYINVFIFICVCI